MAATSYEGIPHATLRSGTSICPYVTAREFSPRLAECASFAIFAVADSGYALIHSIVGCVTQTGDELDLPALV